MTTDRDLLRLAPCPFCGGEAFVRVLNGGQQIICCEGEECFGPRTTAFTLQDATVQWNTRAISAEPCAVKALEFMSYTRSVLDECKNDFNRCPQCDFEDNDATKHSDLFLLLTRKLEELGELSDQRIRSAIVPGVGEPVADDAAVLIATYTNYRGETAVRRIIPKSVRYGSTEWHPEPQWLLLAWDDDKQADREFALKDFGHPAPPRAAVRDALAWCVAEIELEFSRNNRAFPADSEKKKLFENAKRLALGLGESSTSSDGATRPVDYDTNDPMGVEIDEPVADRERIAREDVLAWLAEHHNLELSYDGWDTEAWLVHSVNGGRNDREWKLVSAGRTPALAIAAARDAILSAGARR